MSAPLFVPSMKKPSTSFFFVVPLTSDLYSIRNNLAIIFVTSELPILKGRVNDRSREIKEKLSLRILQKLRAENTFLRYT